MDTTGKWIFGIGAGALLVAIAYTYVAGRRTVQRATDAVTGLAGFAPDPRTLARTAGTVGASAFGAVGATAGAAGQLGSTVFGYGEDIFNLWKTGVNELDGQAGIGPVFPGDLPPSGAGGTAAGAGAFASAMGPDHMVVQAIAGAPVRITDLWSLTVYTVARAYRGFRWDDNDWANIQKYLQSSIPAQDPELLQYAKAAVQQQQSLANIAVSSPQGGDDWVTL